MTQHDKAVEAVAKALGAMQLHCNKDWIITQAITAIAAYQEAMGDGWRDTDELPPREDYYLTVYREENWAEGHFIYKVCRFSPGNKSTGPMWNAEIRCNNGWNVKRWKEITPPKEEG